jgi:hypothetical protein
VPREVGRSVPRVGGWSVPRVSDGRRDVLCCTAYFVCVFVLVAWILVNNEITAVFMGKCLGRRHTGRRQVDITTCRRPGKQCP